MSEQIVLEDKIKYGITMDLKLMPTVFSNFDDTRRLALKYRKNPRFDGIPIYIIELTEHYEIADCIGEDKRGGEVNA